MTGPPSPVSTTPLRVRMAPSPTGGFHVGNAHTALFNWLLARRQGGVFVLRIEDTDRSRSTPENVQRILQSLRWLGLDWDEGPEVGGNYGPYFQSERLDRYREVVELLLAQGAAYRCYCTPEEVDQQRAEQKARGLASPRYDRRCRTLTPDQEAAYVAQGRRPVVRFKVPLTGVTAWDDEIVGPTEYRNAELDDLVILKSDGYPSYNLAAVVDDHDMQISLVLRGADHISNTPKQLLIYQALNWEPPRFAHMPLLLGPDRTKLSSRHGAVNLMDYADQGYLPEAMFNFLALVGWSPGEGETREVFSRQELVNLFSLERVVRAPAVFDVAKLNAINGVYIRNLEVADLTERCLPYLRAAGLIGDTLSAEERRWLEQVIALEQDRLRRLDEVVEAISFFFGEGVEITPEAEQKWLASPESQKVLRGVLERLEGLETFSSEEIEGTLRNLAEELGVSAAKVIHPTRAAVTGRTRGPGLFELMALLGRERCCHRLKAVLERGGRL